jgi:hypothetical protein
MRLPGFEPGLQAWEAYVITTGPQPLAQIVIAVADSIGSHGSLQWEFTSIAYKGFSAIIKWNLCPLITICSFLFLGWPAALIALFFRYAMTTIFRCGTGQKHN